jgi:anti-anti-sigma factor
MNANDLFEIQAEGSISLITLKSPTVNDTSNLEVFEDGMRELVNEIDQRLLLLDFSEVQMIVSRMINSLLLLVKRVRAEGGQVHLCCLDPKVERVLKAMKLDRVFDMYTTREEGLEVMRAFESHCRMAQFA